MSLTVGELFVNLGIKGSEKTVGALDNVKKGLGETASMGLEAKVAIVGAMYALERLFATSGQMGTGLVNFTALTGQSARELQKWQYAMLQAGGTASDITGAVKGIQKAMAAVDLGKGVPEGLMLISQAAGGIDFRKKDDPFYMLEAIQKAVRNLGSSPRGKAIANYLSSSLGLNENVLAGMHRGIFNPSVFAKAPVYSDKEISALDKANVAWSNLGLKIEMAVGRFNARHGGQLVTQIGKITDSTVKLAEALERISTKVGIFEKVAKGLEGSANAVKLFGEIFNKFGGGSAKPGDLLYTKPGDEMFPGFKGSPVGKFLYDLFGSSAPTPAGAGAGNIPVPYMGGAGTQNNVTIHQSVQFSHDGKDHKRTQDDVKKANQDALRQMNLGQFN